MSDTLVESSAESAFLDLHKKLLTQGRPALAELQEAALNRFESLGFPYSKHEMFTFVNTKGLVATSFSLSDGSAQVSEDFVAGHIYPECEDQCLVFVDGVFDRGLSRFEGVSANLVSLSEADQELKDYFSENYMLKSSIKMVKRTELSLNNKLSMALQYFIFTNDQNMKNNFGYFGRNKTKVFFNYLNNEIKVKKRKILLLPGDGIGPEVVAEVKKIIEWFNKKKSLDFETEEDLVGGASYEKHKKPITDEVFYKALESETVILGAVGGPKWDNLEFSKRPERGLLKLRKELKLFANLRPAICFDQLIDASSLKPEIVSGLDIMIVRELTGGIYFGEPRGIKPIENGERKGINTHTYTSSEIIRVAKVAFELAQKRNKKVTSCDKSNVMEAGILWREEVQKVKDEEYPDVELSHMLADNCAMQLLRNPKQFDVIVTDNLFGDILSDEAAMLTGSIGLLPSASLGAKDKNGKIRSMYEPVHGSAPDIAGTGKANPIATILSFSMALRYTLDLDKEADNLDQAVQKVLDDGLRTKDILSKGRKEVSTSQMGDAIISKLK